jgi:PPK2 family polyphosphate:nucleotide phosphotransferase
MNPQGVVVTSFKVPTEEEKAHDFLWRVHGQVPAKRMMAVFNRSHYEDVLVTRVHGNCDEKTARSRFEAINNFETLLAQHNNTLILKFYLHISPEEQQERLAERLEDPTKHWKYNGKDLEESKKWESYRKAYEDVFENCSAIPWHIVPSDQNWYKEYVIASVLVEALEALEMKYPQLSRSSGSAG